MASGEAYRELGEAAWSWVLRHIADDDGPWLPVEVDHNAPTTAPTSDRDCLYDGIAGLAPVLAEIAEHRELDAREQELASSIATRLLTQTGGRVEPSLYIGVAGDAVALRLLAPGSESVALHRLVELMTPMGWHSTWGHEVGADAPLTDVIGGTAGIMLAAIWAGGATAAAIKASRGALRSPLPRRSMRRRHRISGQTKVAAKSGRPTLESAYPPRTKRPAGTPRSSSAPPSNRSTPAAASAQPSMTPTISALAPRAPVMNAGNRGATISLAESFNNAAKPKT